MIHFNLKSNKKRCALILSAAMMFSIGSAIVLTTQERSVSAEGGTEGAYEIYNVTQDLTVYADEKNNARYTDQLIVYDSDWGSTTTGTNEWGVEVVVEWSDTDSAYVVTTVTQNGSGGSATIPEDGFVLSGNSTAGTAISTFATGDEIEFYDNTTYTVYDSTTGYAVVVSDTNTSPNGNATILFSSYGSSYANGWAMLVVCAWSDADACYVVSNKVYSMSSDGESVSIPTGGFVLAMNGEKYYQYGSEGLYSKAAVGDKIQLTSPGLVDTDITISRGGVTIGFDGVNPSAEDLLTGYSVVYTNAAAAYKTLERTDSVIEYAIEMDDSGDWVVTGKYTTSGNAIPNYNGFIACIPASDANADILSVGDTVTVSGTVEQQTAFAVVDSSSLRISIDAINTYHSGNQVILYDDTTYLSSLVQTGYPEPQAGYTASNCWVTEVVCEWNDTQEAYVVTGITYSGTYYTNESAWAGSKIPDNGFVLSGHGDGAAKLANYTMGDTVTIYDYSLETLTDLVSIYLDGVALEEFSNSQLTYDYTLEDDATAAPVVTATAVTRMGKTPNVEISSLSSLTGTVTITVTSPSGSTVKVYSVIIDTVKSSNANLASITVDGTEIDGFSASTRTYTVSVESGSSVPVVAATAEDDGATVEITQATSLSGSATIKVTAEDGTSKTYTVTFEEEAASSSGGTDGSGSNGSTGGDGNTGSADDEDGGTNVGLWVGLAVGIVVVVAAVAVVIVVVKKKKN